VADPAHRRRPHDGHHRPRGEARHRHPPANSTQIGDVAKAAGSPALFALFQAASAVLLLAAASSSFQAGLGLLKALARADRLDGAGIGILPA